MIAAKMAAMGLWPAAFADSAAVTAAGTTATDAAVVQAADMLVIKAGTGGIVLKGGGSKGDGMVVINGTAAAVNLYPAPGGGTINGAAAALSIGINHATTLRCLAPKQWFVMADAALTGTIPLSDEEPAAATETPAAPAAAPPV
jgi:hypothetical protein